MTLAAQPRTAAHQRAFERNAQLTAQLEDANQELSAALNAKSYWESRYRELGDQLTWLCEQELNLSMSGSEGYLDALRRTVLELRQEVESLRSARHPA